MERLHRAGVYLYPARLVMPGKLAARNPPGAARNVSAELGGAMIVELTIGAAAFADTLADMRNWLDRNRCTPARFETKSTAPSIILIRIDFGDANDDHAIAFQAGFADPALSSADAVA
jgi:hypothetical protein